MLAIGVDMDDNVRPASQGQIHTGLQRCPLPSIDQVNRDTGTGAGRAQGCGIA